MSTTRAERPTTLDHQALDDLFTVIGERAATSNKTEPLVESGASPQTARTPSFRAVQPRPRETPQAIPTDWFDVISRTVMVGCVAMGMYLLLTGFSWSPLRKPRTESPVQVAVSQPKAKVVTEAIEKFDVGMRAAGSNPLRDQVETAPEPDPLTSRKLVLQLKKDSGYRLTAKLLRSTAWMERAGVVDGGRFFLELPEMGAVGNAYVQAVLPCPPIAQGPGNVVTGVFEHEADPNTKILTVTFSNGEVIEGVTDNHPFFSVDRNDFVPVSEMREGETVKVVDGLMQITEIKSRFAHPGELLYNLETHNEHVYQVTNSGILVHNSCLWDEWKIGEHALQPKHNWSKLFGGKQPDLSQIRPHVQQVLRDGNWVKVGDIRGAGGKIIGEKLEVMVKIDGHDVWVSAFKDLNGKIILNNAGVN